MCKYWKMDQNEIKQNRTIIAKQTAFFEVQIHVKFNTERAVQITGQKCMHEYI